MAPLNRYDLAAKKKSDAMVAAFAAVRVAKNLRTEHKGTLAEAKKLEAECEQACEVWTSAKAHAAPGVYRDDAKKTAGYLAGLWSEASLLALQSDVRAQDAEETAVAAVDAMNVAIETNRGLWR